MDVARVAASGFPLDVMMSEEGTLRLSMGSEEQAWVFLKVCRALLKTQQKLG